METSPKLATVDIKTLSSSSESSEHDGGSTEDSRNETTEEQQTDVNNEGSSNIEITQQSIPTIEKKTLSEMGYKASEFEESPNHKKKKDLYESLKTMIRENKRPDLTVKIGDNEFRVYSIVLQCYSRIFFNLKNAKIVNLPTDRVTPNSFKTLYNWMISDTPISIPANDLLDLLHASTFLCINPLIEQSLNYFNDESAMSEDKAFLTYLEAKKRNFEFSNQLLSRRIGKFFMTLVAYEEFVKLDILDVCVILNSSKIGVNSELETFMAAIRWLSYDWNARKEHAYKLMECVRFNLVAPWLLTNLQNPDAVEQVSRVVSISQVRQLINEAIAFTSTRLFYSNDIPGFAKIVEQRGIFPPPNRCWIYDKECCYHHKHSCSNITDLDYKDFIKYLKELKKKHNDYWQSLDSSESGQCQCGSSSAGIPNVFKTNLSLLYNFDKKHSLEHEEASSNMQTSASACSVLEDTSHSSMLDDSSACSTQDDSSISSVQEDTSPSSVQDKLEILHKRYSYLGKMSEDDILNQSGSQETKDINSQSQNSSGTNLSHDNSVYWYEEKRVLKLTSSQSFHRSLVDLQYKGNKKDQQEKHKKTKEMRSETDITEYLQKKAEQLQIKNEED